MPPKPIPLPERKPNGSVSALGYILVSQGKLTPNDVDRISGYQTSNGLRFGEAAQAIGLLSETDVMQGLAQQCAYAYLKEGDGNYPSELVAAYHPFSRQVEALRSIRSELLFRWFDEGHRTLTVASVNSADSASFFTANLAVVFSQLGKRTLIVDSNLRSPRQHQIFGVETNWGLSDIIGGRAGSDAISNSKAFPNLYVLPAGSRPPNPQELLGQSSFSQAKDALAAGFDVTLLDSPSFSVGTDALHIAGRSGGLLLLVRKDRTSLKSLEDIGQQLRRVGVRLVGTVIVEF